MIFYWDEGNRSPGETKRPRLGRGLSVLPLNPTDEMVRRAAVAFYRPESEGDWVAPPVLLRNMRAALEAALGINLTVGEVPSEAKEPSTGEQADPGSVPSPEGVRSAAPAESFWSAIDKLGREVGGPEG